MGRFGTKGVLALLLSCAAGCGGSSQKMTSECNGTVTVNGTAMTVCMFGTAANYTQITANAPGGYPSIVIQTNSPMTGSYQSSTPQNGNTIQYDPTDSTGFTSLNGGINEMVQANATISISQLTATTISFTATGTLVEYDKVSNSANPPTTQFDASGTFSNN
jgi:hypothetical protein